MICDNCLNKITKWGWHNNQRLCETCLHNKRPQNHRYSEIKCKAPNIQDLMDKWNSRN